MASILFAYCALAYAQALHAQSWKDYAEQLKAQSRQERAPRENHDAVERQDQTYSAQEEYEPTLRDVRSPVSQGGILDFSSALGDDGAELYGDAENEPTTFEDQGVLRAPSPPSYRNIPEIQESAKLNDVCFIDANTGWVVGDRGVILHTFDGGATWTQQDSGVDVNLFAVSFFDQNYGLAVGGRVMPYLRVGQGVILRTVDGGATWTLIETSALPILRDVKIIDETVVWAAGDSSNLYSTGLFLSYDTGITWTPVEGNRRRGWRAVLYDPIERLGVGITTQGQGQYVEGGAITGVDLQLGENQLYDVAYDANSNQTWLVGDSGLILCSSNFGKSWTPAPNALPNDAARYFDLYSVVAKDGLLAVVGAPSSKIFLSDDQGVTWRVANSGISTPLRKLCFIDRSHGWAVGDLGVILATQDGGQTWTTQRQHVSRAAILALFARANEAPLEAFAQLAGDQGFITQVALLTREITESGRSEEIPLLLRMNEALVQVGAQGVTQFPQFPLAPERYQESLDQVVKRFNDANDSQGLYRLRERMVRLIRTWRPSIVVASSDLTEGSEAEHELNVDLNKSSDLTALLGALAQDAQRVEQTPRAPLQALLLREILGAINDAADPTTFPEHMGVCGLEPWTTSRAHVALRGKSQGDLTLDAAYYCPSLGRAAGEIARDARAILDQNPETLKSVSFQRVYASGADNNAANERAQSSFAGADLPYGGDARRRANALPEQVAQTLVERAGRRRQLLGMVETLARQSANNARNSQFLLSGLEQSLTGLDAELAVEYLSALGARLARDGNWLAAEQVWQYAPREYPDIPQSYEIFRALMQYYCSTELENLALQQGQTTLGQDRNTRLRNALKLAEVVRDFAPDAYMSPELRFPLASAQIALGDAPTGLNYYLNRSNANRDDVWAVRAATEYWLRAPKSDILARDQKYPPTQTANCRRIAVKPYLDGNLDPEHWAEAPTFYLATPFDAPMPERAMNEQESDAQKWRQANRALAQSHGAAVGFAYDQEYLYIAANCPKASGAFYQPNERTQRTTIAEQLNDSTTLEQEKQPPRPRDVTLESVDRLEIALDLNGDYQTAYRFTVDYRGVLCDELWNDKTWNPEIFVAQREDMQKWTLEIAIKLTDLTSKTPQSGDTWRVALKRTAPGAGEETWNIENSDRGEDAFGILTFE
ncbi:MAG: YCF48-related protein [Planctomycetia bacterium]|nr:YCF48-related protein [Planctomycetia bacterium]